MKIIVSIFVKLFLILVLHLRQFFVKRATGDKSSMRKGPVSVSDKWNISVVICDADIPQV
jgi:hypothetical protein